MSKIVVNLDGTKYDLPMPIGMTTRKEQNPNCTAKNSVCCDLNGNLVCAKIILRTDKDGIFNIFELSPCSQQKGKNKKIMDV